MPKFTPEYQVGDWVRVKKVAAGKEVVPLEGINRRIVYTYALPQPVLGRITGMTVLNEGVIHRGDVYGGYRAYRAFEVTDQIKVYLVRRGLTNKELRVLPQDLERVTVETPDRLPYRHVRACPYTEKDRAELSRAAREDMLRGPDGRFIGSRPLTQKEEAGIS